MIRSGPAYGDSAQAPWQPTRPGPEHRRLDVFVGKYAPHVMRIATGEIEDTGRDPGKDYARKGGLKKGGRRGRTNCLPTAEQRSPERQPRRGGLKPILPAA